jgi:hypothetical protein
MDKRKRAMIAGGLILVVAAAAFGIRHLLQPHTTSRGKPAKTLVAEVNILSAPADVQEAAAKLATSRVGYPIVHPEATYLIVSTGNPGDRVALDSASAQPDSANPTQVDVNFKANAAGQSLMIYSLPVTVETEYLFNVDGKIAAIPTLHNPDKLPLVKLDATKRFSMVAPLENAMVGDSGTIHLEGYAQVFEAQFSIQVATAKGRIIGTGSGHAAAGAPAWGSFKADVKYDASQATETGFIILSEGEPGAKIMIPVRFRAPAELG